MAAYESLVLRFETQGAEQTEKSVRALKGELTQMNNALKVMDGENRLLGSSTESLTSRMKMLNLMVDKNAAIMKQAEVDLATYIARQQRLGHEIDDNDATMRRYNGIINACSTKHEELQVQLRATENRMDAMGDQAAQAGHQLDNVNRIMSFGTMMGLRELGSELMMVSRYFQDFAVDSYKTAKSVQASVETVSLVFGDMADEQLEWSKATSEALSVYEGDLNATSGKIMSLAKSYGMMGDMFGGSVEAAVMSGEDLADMSRELTVLAYDLAAMYDTSVEQALGAVESAFKGNINAIEDYGITIQASMLQQKAADLGIAGTVRTMTQAEKNWLAYQVMIDSTTDAQGRWKRELDQGLIPMQEYENKMMTLKAAFGEALRPAIDDVMNKVNAFIGSLAEMDPSIMSMIGGLGAAVVALATITVGLGTVAMMMLTFGAAAGPVFAGVAIAVGAVATAVYAWIESMRTGESFMDTLKGSWEKLMSALEKIHPKLDDAARIAAKLLGVFIGFKITTTIAAGINTVSGSLALFKAGASGAVGIGSKLVSGLFALKGGAAAATTGAAALSSATATTASGLGAIVPAVGSATSALASLGGAAVLAPIAVLVAAVGAIGVGIYQSHEAMNKSLEPEDIGFAKGLSEATATAAQQLFDLEERFSSASFQIQHGSVETARAATESLMQTIAETVDVGLTNINAKYDQQYEDMRAFLESIGELETEHGQQRLADIETREQEEIDKLNAHNEAINAIVAADMENHGTLTKEGLAEINRIQDEMMNEQTAIIARSKAEQEALKANWTENLETMNRQQVASELQKAYERMKTLNKSVEEELGIEQHRLNRLLEAGNITQEEYDRQLASAVTKANESARIAYEEVETMRNAAEERLGDQIYYLDLQTGEWKKHKDALQYEYEKGIEDEKILRQNAYQELLGIAEEYGIDLNNLVDGDLKILNAVVRGRGDGYIKEWNTTHGRVNDDATTSILELRQTLTPDMTEEARETLEPYQEEMMAQFDAMNAESETKMQDLEELSQRDLEEHARRTAKPYRDEMIKAFDAMNAESETKMQDLERLSHRDLSVEGSSTAGTFANSVMTGFTNLSVWLRNFVLPAPQMTPPSIGNGGHMMYDMDSYSLPEAPRAALSDIDATIPGVSTFDSALLSAPSMPSKRYSRAQSNNSLVTTNQTTQNYNISLNLDNVAIHNDNDIDDIARKLTESMKRELFVYGS